MNGEHSEGWLEALSLDALPILAPPPPTPPMLLPVALLPDTPRLVPAVLAQLPSDLAGMPCFESGNGQRFVFWAHLLTRVLRCSCRAKLHSGMLRYGKLAAHRREIPTRQWRRVVESSPEYAEGYRATYPMAHFKEPSLALTLEGVHQWMAGDMAKFVERERQKCASVGCIPERCTCPH